MKKTFKRVVAGILILVTCMSSFVYGTEFDELYRGENLGALWYSEFDSDGTGVNQMEGLVYIDGVLTAVPAVCINPDVLGMAELEYGDLYSSNISVAPRKCLIGVIRLGLFISTVQRPSIVVCFVYCKAGE